MHSVCGLLPPPAAVPVDEVLRENLPDAWKGEETTAIAISTALSQKSGQTLPWAVVKEAIDGALRSHFLERMVDSGPWPCDLAGASVVKLKVPSGAPPTPPPPQTSSSDPTSASTTPALTTSKASTVPPGYCATTQTHSLRPPNARLCRDEYGILSRPGESGDSVPWEGWSHVGSHNVAEVSAGVEATRGADGRRDPQ